MIKIVQIVVCFLVNLLSRTFCELLNNSCARRFIDTSLIRLQDPKKPILDIAIYFEIKNCKFYSTKIEIENLHNAGVVEKKVLELIEFLGCNDVFESYYDFYNSKYSKSFRMEYHDDIIENPIMVEVSREDENVKVNITFCAFSIECEHHDFGLVGVNHREFYRMKCYDPESIASGISAITNICNCTYMSVHRVKSARKV